MGEEWKRIDALLTPACLHVRVGYHLPYVLTTTLILL